MPGTGKKILAADDNEDILEVLAMMLESEGYLVTTVLKAEEVLELKEDLPDLILLDIWMSGVDGRDICKRLKNEPLTRHIPIILVSANKDTEEIALKAGADSFLCKPFEMDDLLKKVARYCN